MKIGFIGLGIMGRPMAKNLLKAGYDVTVDSHSPAAAAELEACGAKVADQPTIGSTCDLVLTMLPNAPQVKQVMLGANGVAAHMQPGSTFIDMTSLNPIASKEIAAELAARGIQMLDAPVSGGEPKAIDGTLSFMVGGEEEVFNTFKPVLLAMGSSAVRCGGIGAGNTTKLANQIIVALNIEAVAEALGGSAPVWLGLIDYGGADSQTAIPGLGSFHGLPLALFSSESSYSACADLSSAGAQALSAQLKQALAGFMTSGSPGWDVWTPQDRDALHFDADSETACITFNSYPDTQESIRAAMAADTSLSAAEKETVEHLYFSGLSF